MFFLLQPSVLTFHSQTSFEMQNVAKIMLKKSLHTFSLICINVHFQICLSNVDLSSVEEVDRILRTYKNPHQVVEFILEGINIISSIIVH